MELLKSKSGKLLIEGHRGAEGLALENSWKALEAGYMEKADLMEVDIQRLKDGTLLLHNGYQLSDGRWLRDLKYSDMPVLEDYEPLVILNDLLDWVKDKPVGLSLDIKNGFGFDFQVFIDTLSLVEKYRLTDKVIFMGWDHGALLKLKIKNPRIKTRGIIRGYPIDIVSMAKKAQLDVLNLDADMVIKEEVEVLHKENIAVAIAELYNPAYERAVDLGADIICCKDPGAARNALASLG